MNRVLAKMKANQVPHFPWTEPDNDMSLTAIAAGPLDEDSKQVMANYRVYRGGDERSSCSVVADAPAKSRRSSDVEAAMVGGDEVERRIMNPEVPSSNLGDGSNKFSAL